MFFILAGILIVQLLAACSEAAVARQTIGTLSWQIEVTAFFSYKSTADRENMLSQILDLWKSSFDDTHNLFDEKIAMVKEVPAPSGFDEYKQLTFRISGKGPAGTSIQTLVSRFSNIISTANIPGVVTKLSRQSQTIYTVNVEIQANFVYTSNYERERLLQQILDIFKIKFARYSFTNLKIRVISEQPSISPGMHLLTFQISGQTTTAIDMNDLSAQLTLAIKTSNIVGVTIPGSSGSFTFESSITLRPFITTIERTRILQHILTLWIQTFGSKYGIRDPQITIISVTTSSDGSYVIKYKITGTSVTPIDVDQITITWKTILHNAKITGIVITVDGGDEVISNGGNGTSSGGCTAVSINQINGKNIYKGTFTATFTVYLAYTSSSIRNILLEKLLTFWGVVLDSQTDNLKMCFQSEEFNVGILTSGLNMHKVIYTVTGTATSTFNTAVVAKTFESLLASTIDIFFTTDFDQCK